MNLFNNRMEKWSNDYILCWLFNIGVEKQWSSSRFQIKNQEEDLVVQHMEEIILLLTCKQDTVLLRRMPDEGLIRELEKFGFEIPLILCPQTDDPSKTITQLVLEDEKLLRRLRVCAGEKQMYLVPYGITEKEEKLAEICSMKIIGCAANVAKTVNSKLYARELITRLHMPMPDGVICNNLDEIKKAWKWLSHKFSRIVIKRPYGASGDGLYLVDSDKKFHMALHILKRSQEETEKWIVEGWYEKKIDLNAQLYIFNNGDIEIISITEQLLNDTIYQGSVYPPALSSSSMAEYICMIKDVGKELFSDGIRGIVGIDSIMTDCGIFPVIEINVRFTLSTYLSALPLQIENRCFQSMYYRVLLDSKVDCLSIKKKMESVGVSFDFKNMEGIFCYNYACMDKAVVGTVGRLFVVIVSKERKELHQLQLKLERILKEEGILYGNRRNSSTKNKRSLEH